MSTSAITADGALLQTGIPGLDLLTMGGLPKNRTTLVSGTTGSAKTIFVTQFLVEGIRQAGEPGVFVTLEESPDDIRNNMRSLGWDIARFESDAMWLFVDGSPSVEQEDVLVGDYDLGGLLARIQAAVAKVGAKRLAIDAIGAIFIRFSDQSRIRAELFRISRALRNMNVTAIVNCERVTDYGEIGRYGIEEFVVDNVIVLRNVLEAELRRRTLEIVKLRGVSHRRGEFPFVVINGRGIDVVSLSAIPLEHKSSSMRATFGNAKLDLMCNGGPFRDSTILVSGPAGAGKTLMATEFAAGAAATGERCLFLGFEESHDQLFKSAASWGRNFTQMETDGLLQIVCEYPESLNLDDRLIRIKEIMSQFRPHRLVLDNLSSLGRFSSQKSLRDFVLGLTAFIKQEQILALFTATVNPIISTVKGNEIQLTSFTDSIILLRYVESGGQMRHGVTILRMRGSPHETQIREFTINDKGMQVGQPFPTSGSALIGSSQ